VTQLQPIYLVLALPSTLESSPAVLKLLVFLMVKSPVIRRFKSSSLRFTHSQGKPLQSIDRYPLPLFFLLDFARESARLARSYGFTLLGRSV